MINMRLRIAIALTFIFLLATRLPQGLDYARVLAAGRPLFFSLLTRAQVGDLPLGPTTPPIWALARASSLSSPAATGGQSNASLVTAHLAVEQALRQAATRLSQARGAERLAGVVWGSLGEYDQAEARLTLGTLRHQEDPFLRLAEGNVLDELGQHQAAISTWQQIGALRGISDQLYREGVRLANRGQRQRAEQLLLLATQVDPGYANPYHALGGFYWGQDDQKAAEMYRKALAVGGLEPFFARLAEGKLALLEGRSADAAAALRAAVELRPDHGEANQFLGVALRQTGQPEAAIPVLQRAARLMPDSPWPLVQLGQIYLDLLREEEAIPVLSEATRRRADLPLAFDLLGQAYLAVDQPEQAALAWQQAALLRPDNVPYRVRLGDAWQEAGEVEKAIEAYRAALILDPENDYARRQLERLGVPAEGGS